MVGPANLELLEKDLVQFIVVVLAGVDQDVFGVTVEFRDHAA